MLRPEQGNRYSFTIKCVALVAVAAGITTAALYAQGGPIESSVVTPDALSTAFTTTVLIGKRLLSTTTVTNAIANQSIFANAPLNLQVDLSQIFNYTGSFTRKASASCAGSMSVIVTAVDPFKAIAERSFDLNLAGFNNNNNLPQWIQNPPAFTVDVGKGIAFQISNNTFFDADNDPLTYSVSTTEWKYAPCLAQF